MDNIIVVILIGLIAIIIGTIQLVRYFKEKKEMMK